MDILMSFASKVGELLVEPTGRQLGYLIFCEGNIKALVVETEKLKDKRAAIQMSMNAATTQLEVISPEVIRWVSEVDKIMNELGKFLEEDAKVNKMCFNGWCPNLKLRHFLGRKAKKNTEVVLKLQQEGKFDRISYPAPPTGMHFVPSMKAFGSRTKILKQVMEALRDDTIHTIAICGMGGIGKTTMATEVAGMAQEEKLFGAVVKAVVAQNPNVMNIQEQIADALNFKIEKKTESGRATALRSRIEGIEKILIILDDMWERLDLEAIGIPSGSEHPRCTILLTSRNEEVARTQMRSQRTFVIEVLPENEAWNLFEEMAGSCIKYPDIHPIAEQISNECKGLPVAIVTVGRALENRSKEEWNDALLRLRKPIVNNISAEVGANVYSSIELSYTFLRSEEAKFCFLLCCLFPEDYDIPIETLVKYGKGLRLFESTDAMEEARNRVHTLVQNLKRCFLLLESDKRGCVKLHDVVRDVAISIASKEHGFVVRCEEVIEEWPEIDSWENCTAVSLVTDEIKNDLDSLVCPKLKLLHLSTNYLNSQEFNESFFGGMEKLEVLACRNIYIESLPSQLQFLKNMRTLYLQNCLLDDISSIGALEKLEILSLFGSVIQELPREIGLLQHLKLLDIKYCVQLERIPPGVLSSLTRLEELYIGESFSKWSPGQGDEAKICASLDELISLSDHLKVLDIHIPQVELLGQSAVLFNKLTRFWILLSDEASSHEDCLFENYLCLEGDIKSMIESEIHVLLNKCENLELGNVKSLKNVTQLNEDGFSRLKVLYIWYCEDVEYLINFKCINWLPSLNSLEMYGCHKLRVVFDFDGLVVPQLPEKEKTNTTDQEKDHLHGIDHRCLGCLPVPPPTRKHKPDQGNNTATQKKSQDHIVTSMRSSHSDVQAEMGSAGARDHGVGGVPDGSDKVLHNLETVEVSGCKSVGVIFDFGESQGPFPPVLNDLNRVSLASLPRLMQIWKITKKGLHQLVVTSSFRNLRFIEVFFCGRLRYIFSPSIAKLLVMLESIDVRYCESMKAVINVAKEGGEEDKQEESAFTTISFPNLRSIVLRNLDNLSCFCDQPNYVVQFPSLESVFLNDCPMLETFIAAATMSAEDTPMLRHVEDDDIEIFEGRGDLNTAIHRNFQAKQEKLRQQAVGTKL